MTSKAENAALLGTGVAACAVCCAGPILGFIAALGLGTAAGTALFGGAGLLVAAAVAAVLIVRRRRRSVSCAGAAVPPAEVALPAPTLRPRS